MAMHEQEMATVVDMASRKTRRRIATMRSRRAEHGHNQAGQMERVADNDPVDEDPFLLDMDPPAVVTADSGAPQSGAVAAAPAPEPLAMAEPAPEPLANSEPPTQTQPSAQSWLQAPPAEESLYDESSEQAQAAAVVESAEQTQAEDKQIKEAGGDQTGDAHTVPPRKQGDNKQGKKAFLAAEAASASSRSAASSSGPAAPDQTTVPRKVGENKQGKKAGLAAEAASASSSLAASSSAASASGPAAPDQTKVGARAQGNGDVPMQLKGIPHEEAHLAAAAAAAAAVPATAAAAAAPALAPGSIEELRKRERWEEPKDTKAKLNVNFWMFNGVVQKRALAKEVISPEDPDFIAKLLRRPVKSVPDVD